MGNTSRAAAAVGDAGRGSAGSRRFVLFQELFERDEEEDDAAGQLHGGKRDMPFRQQDATEQASHHDGDRGDHKCPHRDLTHRGVAQATRALGKRTQHLERPERDDEQGENLGRSEHRLRPSQRC